jgi:hypothetical protein
MPEREQYFSGSNRVNNLPQALLLAGVFVIGLYLAFLPVCGESSLMYCCGSHLTR